MKRGIPYKGGWICIAVFALCAGLVKPVQDHLEKRLGESGPEPDLLYFSSPAVVKKMSLGFAPLIADLYWMRAIQYYGRRDEADKRAVRYKNLPVLLDITTTLDPGLMEAYRAGANFLAEPEPLGAGKPEEALRLLDKGIREHPQEWGLLQDKGFIYYWFLKDYKSAGEVWRAASCLPGAPHWLEPLAAMSLSKGGSIEIAQALWQNQYRESTRADVRENARNHLISIEVARDIWSLEALLEKYRERHQAYPPTLKELLRSAGAQIRLEDPLGSPYLYNPATGAVSLHPDSKVTYLPLPDSYRASLVGEP